MSQIIDEETGEVITFSPNSGDHIHTRKTRNMTLDQEDYIKINSPSWNKEGTPNKADVKARLQGAKSPDWTLRGERLNTHRQRQAYDYVDKT